MRCSRRSDGSRSRFRRARVEPERVVAHLGPTNSGKTHAALEELVAKGDGRVRRAAADARAGGAPTARRLDRLRERRPRDRRGARERARAGDLLDGGDGAAVGGAARPRRGAVGRRLGARLGLDDGCCSPASTARSSCSARSMRSRSSSARFPRRELKVFERMLPLELVGERTLRSLTPARSSSRSAARPSSRSRVR